MPVSPLSPASGGQLCTKTMAELDIIGWLSRARCLSAGTRISGHNFLVPHCSYPDEILPGIKDPVALCINYSFSGPTATWCHCFWVAQVTICAVADELLQMPDRSSLVTIEKIPQTLRLQCR